MRLLLIEDNAELARLLAEKLAPAGFSADFAASGREGLEMLELVSYAAVVLDLGLPDMDGLEVLRRLRRREPALPVLILTARGQVSDRVTGLETGADDYLVKPFAHEEVTARLNVLLRRRGQAAGETLELANLIFDTRHRQVEVDGANQVLSAQELDLLEILLRRSGRVVAKARLDDQLFGLSAEVSPNALEVAVYRLRKRLQRARAAVEIHTVRGVGYMLAAVSAGPTPARPDPECPA
jgi:DNA-binding response OmpR family regulator